MGLDAYKDGSTDSSVGGIKNTYTDGEILNKLREYYDNNGKFTSKEWMDNVSSPSYSTVQRRFGTFNKAKEEAGIPLDKSGGHIPYIDDGMRSPSQSKAFVIGCLLTDGWIHSSSDNMHIGFQVKDKELAQEFAMCLSDWMGLRWNGWNDGKTEMEASGPIEIEDGDDNWRIKKGSKNVVEYIENESYMSKPYEELISEFDRYRVTLMSSMWDCEGSIDESGRIRFANSDKNILVMFIRLVESLTDMVFDSEWEWLSDDKKYRSYGDFKVSPKISDSDVRNIIIPRKYSKQVADVIESKVVRKSGRLEEWD